MNSSEAAAKTVEEPPKSDLDPGQTSSPLPGFGWKQFLLWCLPALLLGAYLRLTFFTAIPEAYFGGDSQSYFQAAVRFWTEGHHLSFNEKRRWLYPLLCLPLPALPVSPAHSIAFLQHLLGLATAVAVGWIVAHLTRYRLVWVPIVTLFMATDLDLLRNEHELIGDTVFLAGIVATVALAMPPDRLRERRRLFWFLFMAALVVAIKPHGRGFWLASVIAAACITRQPWRWKIEAWAAIAFGVAMVLTTGQKRQGNWLLLNSTLPLVNLEGSKWAVYRQALKPTVLKACADFERGQYAWAQHGYKKALGDGDPDLIDPVWTELTRRRDDTYLQVCSDLAREGIRTHPLAFAELTLTKILIACAAIDSVERFDPPTFWQAQDIDNMDHWPRYPEVMILFYQMTEPAYNSMVKEREKRSNIGYPVIAWLRNLHTRAPFLWMREILDPVTGMHSLAPGCLGVLTAFGLLFFLRPARWAGAMLIVIPSILVLVTVFAIGDAKLEYILPVRWAGFTVIAASLDDLLVLAAAGLQSMRGKLRGRESST